MDFVVRVAVPDANALRDLVVDSFADREDVAHVETSLIFEHARAHEKPNFIDFEG